MGAFVVPGAVPVTSWTSLVVRYQNVAAVKNLLGPWRPPQWSQGSAAQLYSLTVAKIVTVSEVQPTTVVSTVNGVPNPTSPFGTQTLFGSQRQSAESVTYFFDAVLRAEHRQDLVRTEHPVQSGASIVDHAYLRPARVILEIGMSDAMGSFAAGQFTSSASRSVSAYQTLLDLQSSRVPLTLSTRLNQYANMLIESIGAVEDARTRFAGKFQVVFSQIIVATVATKTVTARPDQTDATNEGVKQPVTPDPTVSSKPGVLNFPGAADITAGGLFPGGSW